MFEDLRELVRAEEERDIRRTRYAARMGRATIREGEEAVATIQDNADDLITFIDELETPPEP